MIDFLKSMVAEAWDEIEASTPCKSCHWIGLQQQVEMTALKPLKKIHVILMKKRALIKKKILMKKRH